LPLCCEYCIVCCVVPYRAVLCCAAQEKLGKGAGPALEAAWKQKQPGLDLEKQFGFIRDLLPQPGPAAPPPSAPLAQQLEFMLTGWKHTRCLLPYRCGFAASVTNLHCRLAAFLTPPPPVSTIARGHTHPHDAA
jgi:hypothetical protein